VFDKIARAFTILDVAEAIIFTSDASNTAGDLMERYNNYPAEPGTHTISKVTDGGRLIGLVDTDDVSLAQDDVPLSTLLLPIDLSAIASAQLPLVEAPALFTDVIKPILVVQDADITHIVFWFGMLDSLVFKYMLLGLLLEFESLLRQYLLDLEGLDIAASLPSDRARKIAGLIERAPRPNPHISPRIIDFLNLKELGILFASLPENPPLITLTEGLSMDDFFNQTRILRNRLAHGLRIWDMFEAGPSKFIPLYTNIQLAVSFLGETVKMDTGVLS
jgi:hypothetical protein